MTAPVFDPPVSGAPVSRAWVVSAGCGVLVGLVIGAVIVMKTATPDISGTGACILIAASAAACGVAALVHGERFWDGLMDSLPWLSRFHPWL